MATTKRNAKNFDRAEEQAVWKEIEALARTLLHTVPGDSRRTTIELRATIPADSGQGAFHARVKRVSHSAGKPSGIVVALERRPPESAVESDLRSRYCLTRKEAVVALLLAERLSNREIAAELSLSAHTARRHTEKVLLKLGLKRRTEVAGMLRRRPARPVEVYTGPELLAS